MKIAVYGKKITAESRPYIEDLHKQLRAVGAEVRVYVALQHFLQAHCDLGFELAQFGNHEELWAYGPDFLITIGGDGTILDAATLVRDSGIPILGINTGRLGFLSNVSKENIPQAINALTSGRYGVGERRLLTLNAASLDLDLNFALNEVTVSRKDSTAMVTVQVWINDQFLNSYWADGLIVATPTGSTGYSLSCNGPIIMPGAESLVITPIAPHNLNVRPFVIPNHYKIKLLVESREGQFLVSLDSRIYTAEVGEALVLETAPFNLRLVETEVQNFAQTLRNKLLWGMDKRN